MNRQFKALLFIILNKEDKKISQFQKDVATCLLLGSWNTAIINPKWLAKNIFEVPDGEEFGMEMSFNGSVKFRTLIRDIYIAPTNDRLVMYPVKEEEELFKRIDSVTTMLYKKLPYTPITAIGHNFTYILDGVESFTVDVFKGLQEYDSVYDNINTGLSNEVLIKHSLLVNEDEHVKLNLNYKKDGNKKILDLNYHYQVNQIPDLINHALNKCYSNYVHSQNIKEFLIS